jgi:hypothetical protein
VLLSPAEGRLASRCPVSEAAHVAAHVRHEQLIRATGGDLAATQKARGHASIRTTIDVYTHLQVSDGARAVEAMEETRENASAGPRLELRVMKPMKATSGFEPLYEALQASA